MRAGCLALAIALGSCATLAATTAAHAQDATQTVILTIVVNDVNRGEHPVVLTGDDILVPDAVFVDAGIHVQAGRSLKVRGAAHRSLASLVPLLSWSFDEKELVVRIVADPTLFATTEVDLFRKPPPGLLYKKDTSAFFNYAPHLVDGRSFDLFTETGISVDGNLLFTGLSYTVDHRLVRGLTNVTIDDRPSMRRVVLGDSFATSGALGGGLFLGGAQIARNFELDPYFVRVPALGWGGMVSTPSTVDVYVNDTLVRREQIGPGPFSLTNLTVPAGSGVTRYVVRDAYGTEQQLSSTYYVSPGALGEGVSEYAYAVGARRDRLALESFAYGDPGILGRHRFGLSDAVTVGGRFDAGREVLSAGPTLTASLPIGSVDLSASASTEGGARGAAAMLGYAYVSRRFATTAFVRMVSDSYSTLSLHPADDRGRYEGSASVALPFGRATWTAMQTFVRSRDFGRRAVSALTANVQVAPSVALIVTVSGTAVTDHAPLLSAFASVNFAAGGGVNASVSGRAEGGSGSTSFDVNKPLPRGVGYGYRASATLGDVRRYAATAQGQSTFGRVAASVIQLDGEDHTYLEASGSIVAVAGGGVFFSRAIQQGFAVLSVPGAKGVRGYLDNQPIGRTDGSGKVVANDLLPYYGNRVGISDSDLPLDYGILSTEQVVAPPYRGGVLVEFAVHRTRFFRGRLVVHAAGARLVPVYGELTMKGAARSHESPIGKSGEFELEGLDAGPYRATVQWSDGECAFDVVVPASARTILDLGELACESP